MRAIGPQRIAMASDKAGGRNPLSPNGLRRRDATCFVAARHRSNSIAFLPSSRIRRRGARNATLGTFTTGC